MTFRMRAVVVREYGGKAEIVELPAPEVVPGHILIKIAAAGNESDGSDNRRRGVEVTHGGDISDDPRLRRRRGRWGRRWGNTRFGVGESNIGQLLLPPVGAFGTYAEYVAVSEQATLTRIPSGVDLVNAPAAFNGEGEPVFDGKTVIVV